MTTRFGVLGLLALGALVFGSARAQVSVQDNVTNNGRVYHYEYSVNNQTPAPICLRSLSLTCPPPSGSGAITRTTSPC